MTRAVRWLSLEIEGLGVWREPVEVRFPDGLGVLSLANESGKSTLIRGLCAVLYGMPADEIARWRSWGSSGPCRGRLDFIAGDRWIRIRRDIATHQTTISEIEEDGRTRAVLFDGPSNPNSRIAIRHDHRGALRRTLGAVADEEIFRATFLVTQPVIPAGKLKDAVKRLITGFGQMTGDEARDTLFNDVKRLTRATAELGIHATGTRPTNQRKDGLIELREAEIERMIRDRDSTAGSFDSLAGLEETLRAAEEALARAQEADAHARTDADRLAAFRRDLNWRDDARTARAELAGVLAGLDEEIALAEGLEKRLLDEFADLESVPDEIESLIRRAIHCESRLGELRTELARVEASVEGKRKVAVGGSPWGSLPDAQDPVAWVARVRAAASRWCDSIDAWEEALRAREEAEAEIALLAAVAALPDETRDALGRLPAVLEDLEERERMAARSEEPLRLLEEGIIRRRETFARRYAPLEGVTPETFFPILEKRAAKHRRLSEIEAQMEGIRATGAPSGIRRWIRPAAVAVPAAAIAVAASLLLHLPVAVVTLAGLVVATLALLLMRRASRSFNDLAKRLFACEREAAEIRTQLRFEFLPPGPWLPDDAETITRAHAAFLEREAEAEAIARDEEALRAGSLAGSETRTREDYRAERGRLEAEARAIEAKVGVPAPEAVAAYRRLVDRREACMDSLASRAREIGGEDRPDDLLSMPAEGLAAAWRPLLDAGAILGFAAPTLEELRAKLAALSPREWDRWEGEARAFTDSAAALTAEDSDLRAKREAVREGEAELLDVKGRVGEERIAASGDDLAALNGRIRDRIEVVKRIEESRRAARRYLESARGGPFADRIALAASLAEVEDRRRDAQARMDRSIEESDLVREYERASTDPAAQDRMRREVETRAASSGQALEAAKEAFQRARANLEASRPASTVNIASLDIEIERERAAAETLRRRADAIVRAWRILGEAIEEYSASHRETLTERIDSRFRAITRKDGRAITLDTDLEVAVMDDGVASTEAELSQGAQDQLAFCLRLAVADLIGGELLLPLLLDDPFVHSDAERLERIREALAEAARERQILLFTQDDRLCGWGRAIEIARP